MCELCRTLEDYRTKATAGEEVSTLIKAFANHRPGPEVIDELSNSEVEVITLISRWIISRSDQRDKIKALDQVWDDEVADLIGMGVIIGIHYARDEATLKSGEAIFGNQLPNKPLHTVKDED